MPDENPPINPLHTSLKEAHAFARTTPALDICVDYLEQIVHYHQYTGHPDDECNYESCMREELEIYLSNAMRVQEEVEKLVDLILEQPDMALKFGAFEELHRLRSMYSNKK
tara:strand:+ start:1992 stop:2324 length:333 start_codon:yes stop_codon:yes gene_type:complete